MSSARKTTSIAGTVYNHGLHRLDGLDARGVWLQMLGGMTKPIRPKNVSPYLSSRGGRPTRFLMNVEKCVVEMKPDALAISATG